MADAATPQQPPVTKKEIFGWCKTVGGFRRSRYLGAARTRLASYLVGAAYNLLRMGKLLATA